MGVMLVVEPVISLGEMRVGEAATPDGRWIPIMCVSVLFHDVCGVIIVVYAKVCGWKSLSRSLYVNSMVQDK